MGNRKTKKQKWATQKVQKENSKIKFCFTVQNRSSLGITFIQKNAAENTQKNDQNNVTKHLTYPKVKVYVKKSQK